MLWLETNNSDDPESVAKKTQLSKESAELLLCSEEAVELIRFLREHKLRNDLLSDVAKVFNSPRAAEARTLLVGLPELVEITGQRSYHGGDAACRDFWSKAAGMTCPDGEFETFRGASKCESCAKEALYGRNLALMRKNPEAAFTSTLQAYQHGVPSLSGSEGLKELFMVDAPLDVDFESFERRLPADEPLPGVRYPLFRKWAEIDPVGAANHLISVRLDPSLAGAIVHGCSLKKRTEIIALVSQFPEGPYFDHAAVSAAAPAAGQPGILELIQKIQDPKLREDALEALERARSR